MASDVPVLVCIAGALYGQRITVPEGGLQIGRADDNHVVVEDEGVSRFHARLLYDNGSLWLQDAGSRNGLFVNGVRVTGHQALKVGDELTVALHTFAIRWADDTASADDLTAASDRGAAARDSGASAGPSADGAGDPAAADADGRRRRWFWPFN